jgi:branched-chain amino acid transport system substrate-binding protein
MPYKLLHRELKQGIMQGEDTLMDRTIFIGIVVCILVLIGGIAAFIRYRYTRPNTRDVRFIASATIAAVVILIVAAYSLPQVTASPRTDPQKLPSATGSTIIKIAADLPDSGLDQDWAPVENAAHLAVDQANAHHTIPGYTLVFDPKDDVGPAGFNDPAVGAANVTEFISDALVAGIIGPVNSGVADKEMPITNKAPIALISPSNTNPCLTEDTAASGCSGANNLLLTLRPTGKVNYFRVVTTDDYQGLAGAVYMARLGYKKAYVIDDAETYGIRNANVFTGAWAKVGGLVLGHSSEPSTTTSYISLLKRVEALHPDFIYFGGLDTTGGTLIRQQMLKIPGLQNLPFVSDDGTVSPAFATAFQPLGGGPVYGTVAVVDQSNNPKATAFQQQYAAAFPKVPSNAWSPAAYDAANILIQAIKTSLANGVHTPASSSDAAGAVTFRTAVIAAIQHIQYDGITGHQSFDANGDTNLKIITIYTLGMNAANKPDWLVKSQIAVQ